MGSTSSTTGRDSIQETETHNKEFGTKHVTERSSGFHPSLIELHAPSAGLGILFIVGIVCLIFVLYKCVTKYFLLRGRHRALRHYYHNAEAANYHAPLYPREPRFDEYRATRDRFLDVERPAPRRTLPPAPLLADTYEQVEQLQVP